MDANNLIFCLYVRNATVTNHSPWPTISIKMSRLSVKATEGKINTDDGNVFIVTMVLVIFLKFSSDNERKQKSQDELMLCKTLLQINDSSELTLFEWRYKRKPERIMRPNLEQNENDGKEVFLMILVLKKHNYFAKAFRIL